MRNDPNCDTLRNHLMQQKARGVTYSYIAKQAGLTSSQVTHILQGGVIGAERARRAVLLLGLQGAGPLHEDELDSCGGQVAVTPASADQNAAPAVTDIAACVGTPPQEQPSIPSTSPQAGSDPLKPEVSGVGGKNLKRRAGK